MKTDVPCFGFIPARYASSRFPGKPLADILGKPMFWRVYERARRCARFSGLAVATDDERILNAARSLDVPVIMTRSDHASGTDRVYEAAALSGVPPEAVVVNIQGDEPALEPAMLAELVEPFFLDPEVRVTTLAHAVDAAEAARPDRVKVAMSLRGTALYFSRAPIPFSAGDGEYWGHIGLYAFRMETLARFVRLGPAPLEQRERLEQLRFLENDIPVRVVRTRFASQGVDRPEDVPRAAALILAQERRDKADERKRPG